MELASLTCSSAYADGDKSLAAAANGAKLKTLRKRDSKFVKKKLQRQLELQQACSSLFKSQSEQ